MKTATYRVHVPGDIVFDVAGPKNASKEQLEELARKKLAEAMDEFGGLNLPLLPFGRCYPQTAFGDIDLSGMEIEEPDEDDT